MLARLLPFLFLTACAHHTVAPIKNETRTTLIPRGTHQQTVTVHVKKGDQRQMRFSGVLEVREDHTTLIGLTPFGSTLFRVKDSGGHIEFETENEQMKKAAPYIQKTFEPIREMLKIPYPPAIREKTIGELHFEFVEMNAQEMPMKTRVQTPDFDLEIDEVGYAP
jgi:hypothetical protein